MGNLVNTEDKQDSAARTKSTSWHSGQDLTITNETRTNKKPTHSKVTGLQKRVINVIKKQILNGK